MKGSKPLIRFKFYLDIKNHVICSKIEAKIKELGGVSFQTKIITTNLKSPLLFISIFLFLKK